MTKYRPQIKLHEVADCPRQFKITSTEEKVPDGVAFEDHYVHFGGYFGAHGPNVFRAAPELLEILQDLLDATAYDHGGDVVLYKEAEAIIARINGGAA